MLFDTQQPVDDFVQVMAHSGGAVTLIKELRVRAMVLRRLRQMPCICSQRGFMSPFRWGFMPAQDLVGVQGGWGCPRRCCHPPPSLFVLSCRSHVASLRFDFGTA